MASTPTASTTSKPLTSGICTSRNTTCGASSAIARTASAPPVHSGSSVKSASALRSELMRVRAHGSSSTISARMLMRDSRMKRHFHDDDDAAFGARGYVQALRVAIQRCQALARVRESNARARGWFEAAAVVGDDDREPVILSARTNLDATVRAGACKPVTHAVLHERLQEQRWHLCVEHFRIRLDLERQLSAESFALDIQVGLDE